MKHLNSVHGLPLVVWDDVSMPQYFWASIKRLPNGCWVPVPDTDKHRGADKRFREQVVTRQTGLEWKDVMAAVPTCGDIRCCNPAHLCVTERTVLSAHPKEDPT